MRKTIMFMMTSTRRSVTERARARRLKSGKASPTGLRCPQRPLASRGNPPTTSAAPSCRAGSPDNQQRTLSLACPGPQVVDEVQEVQQRVATAVEPGLTGAAGVSGSTLDLGGSHLERYAHAFEWGGNGQRHTHNPVVRGRRKASRNCVSSWFSDARGMTHGKREATHSR